MQKRVLPENSDSTPSGGLKLRDLPDRTQLLHAKMRPDINLSAINHSKVTSDTNRLTRSFLAVPAKALTLATDFICDCYFHFRTILR